MKKIAIIATAVALPGEKGLARLHYLAEFFSDYGYEAEIITSRFQHWEKRFRTQAEVDAMKLKCKVTMVEERGYTKNIQLRRIYSHRVLGRNMVKYMEQNTYDLVYCVIPDNYVSAQTAAYAKRKGIPFVMDIEDLWPEAMRMVFDVPVISDVMYSGFTMDAKKAFRMSSAVIGSSDTYRDYPKKYHIDIPKKETVYVGNDFAAFDKGAKANLKKVDKPEGEFWITYAGTLGTSYDIATLIRAMDELEKRGVHDVRTVLLGDGPLRPEFEELAHKLNGKVSFIGFIPHCVMAAYLVKSDVVINSLVRKASQSIVSKIGDYLASGKPMLNTGLDPEFVAKVEADGFGINVEPENVNALVDAILALKNNPEKCAEMSRKARIIGEQQFDRPTSYKKIVAVVDDLLHVKR